MTGSMELQRRNDEMVLYLAAASDTKTEGEGLILHVGKCINMILQIHTVHWLREKNMVLFADKPGSHWLQLYQRTFFLTPFWLLKLLDGKKNVKQQAKPPNGTAQILVPQLILSGEKKVTKRNSGFGGRSLWESQRSFPTGAFLTKTARFFSIWKCNKSLRVFLDVCFSHWNSWIQGERFQNLIFFEQHCQFWSPKNGKKRLSEKLTLFWKQTKIAMKTWTHFGRLFGEDILRLPTWLLDKIDGFSRRTNEELETPGVKKTLLFIDIHRKYS